MKKAILLACAALLCGSAALGGMISDDPGELAVAGQYWFPGAGDFDLFESGYGLAVSYREWFSFPWGVGVNLGLAQWQVDGGSDAYKYDKLIQYDGDALLIPLGASVYFNLIDWDNWNLILETGLQYVFVDSNVSVFNNEEAVQRRQDIDIDGAVLWNLGAEFEYMISENIFLQASAGYQIDAIAGNTEYSGRSVRDTRFEGFFGRLGAKFLF